MNIEQLSDLALLAWYSTHAFPIQLQGLTDEVNFCHMLLSLPIGYQSHNRLKDKVSSPPTPHPLNLVIVRELEIVLIGIKWAFHFDGIQQLNLV